MRQLRTFVASYLSVFGILLYFQLNWAQYRARYDDIFFRVVLAFILTAPLLYLLLQLVHLLRATVKRTTDTTGSARLLYPFALFHCKWFFYVSSQPWKSATAATFLLFGIVETLVLLRSALHKAPAGAEGPGALAAFAGVNSFFIGGFRGIFKAIRHALGGTVTVAGITLYPVTWLLLSMQALLFIKYSAFSFPHPLLLPIGIAAMVLLPVLLVHTIWQLTAGVRLIGNILLTAVTITYAFLTLYHLTEGTPFDLSLLRLNADLLTHSQSWRVIADRLTVQSYLFVAYCIGIGICMVLFRRRQSLASHTTAKTLLSGSITFACYLVLFLVPFNSIDPPRSCYHSARRYAAQQASLQVALQQVTAPYPYLHPADSTLPVPEPTRLPDIILICLESFNGLLVGDTIEDGREITPFFNSLIPRGVYLEHFYGNSIQTARGFFGLMTGTYPGFGEKESTAFPELSIRGIPAILDDYGYATFFIKAYRDITYDNTGEFMTKAGFSTVRAITDNLLSEKEKNMVWGWGLQDDYFYRKCFSMVDTAYKTFPREKPRPPLFLTTFNVSHHMMFKHLPNDRKRLYPDAGQNEFSKNFRNSMFLADSCLQEVFTQIDNRPWLEDPIIIVVGDHGFPAGMHSSKNEKGTWEENFRTPLLIIWNGHLQPQRLTRYAYSQVDLMPTLFDLLHIAPAHHSVGKSVFAQGARDPVLVSQPYDGVSLVSIVYPFKFIQNLSSAGSVLYNLENDPDERTDLLPEYNGKPVVTKLRGGIHKLMINQMLIERNRLWPDDGRQ